MKNLNDVMKIEITTSLVKKILSKAIIFFSAIAFVIWIALSFSDNYDYLVEIVFFAVFGVSCLFFLVLDSDKKEKEEVQNTTITNPIKQEEIQNKTITNPVKKPDISNIFNNPYKNYSPPQYIPPVRIPTRRTRTPSEKLHLQIDYEDADGVETSREIVISRKSNVDDYYIRAKCLLRNEKRTFVIHRIKHCFNPETGEFVSNIKKYVDDFYS